MTGEPENESGSAGGSSVPDPSDAGAGGESYHPRPFRSWASAHADTGPSLWERLTGLFKRRPKELDEAPAELDSAEVIGNEVSTGQEEEVAAPVQAADEVADVVEVAEESRDEVVWIQPESSEPAMEPEPPLAREPEPEPEKPWQPEPEPVKAWEPEPAPVKAWEPKPEPEPANAWEPRPEPGEDSEPGLEQADDPEGEPVAASAPEPMIGPAHRSLHGSFSALAGIAAPPAPKRRGLLARLFGRKPKQQPVEIDEVIARTNENPIEVVDEPAPMDATAEPSSVEMLEALPAEEPESVSEVLPTAETTLEFIPAEPITDSGFASVDEALPAAELPPLPEPETAKPRQKRGIFARIFGIGKRAEPEVVPELTPAENEATAGAAADALDRVAEDVFPPIEQSPTLAADTFAEAPTAEPFVEASAADELAADLAAEKFAPQEELVEPVEPRPVEADPVAELAEPPAMEIDRVDEPVIAEGFGTVDDALPTTEGAEVSDALTFIEPEPEAPAEPPAPPTPKEKRPSFIGRLFGRRSKEAPARPSLEIEIHQDRIDAAVDAFDANESQFAPPLSTPSAEGDSLPAADDPFISLGEMAMSAPPAAEPTEHDLRFAPPPSPPSPPSPPLPPSPPEAEEREGARSTLEMEQLPEVIETQSRDTMEVVQESRDTVELAQDSRPTTELELGDTLEIIEEKTDEFEVPPAEEAPAAEDAGADTLEVSKQSWIKRLFGIRQKTQPIAVTAAGATVVEGNPVFLFSKFRTFYNEIIRFKHQKSEFTAGFATAIVTDYTADLSPDAAAESLSKRLAEMLELQMAEAKWMGGEAGDRYPDAQYAMAALADESFTHMEWEGQAGWPKHLLEVRLYRTHAADIELFRRIDKLLKEKPDSAVARDLARVYLLVIAAGFKGKYRPFGLTRALADYRQRLFEYIHSGDPLLLYAEERKIFPEALSATLEGHAVSRFSAAQRWAAILLFLVAAYAAIAHLAWNRVSAELKDVTARIKSGNTTAGVR